MSFYSKTPDIQSFLKQFLSSSYYHISVCKCYHFLYSNVRMTIIFKIIKEMLMLVIIWYMHTDDFSKMNKKDKNYIKKLFKVKIKFVL